MTSFDFVYHLILRFRQHLKIMSLACKAVLLKRFEELIDATLNGSPLQLEELEKQIQVAQRELNSLHNSDASISTLPDEVLTMVFEEGMHLNGDSPCHFGSLASHVTHHWRSVALAAPRLWSKIRWREPCTEQEMERVSTFLSRSGTSPIEIRFRPYDTSCQAIPPEFVQLTRGHIRHCVHISIWDIHPNYLTKVLEDIFCYPAPMLRSIDLGLDEAYEPEPLLNTYLFPLGAPLLTIAHLSSIHVSDFVFCLPAFENITTLRLIDFCINDKEEKECASFRDTLMAMPALYYLDLRLDTTVESFSLYEVFLHTVKFLCIQAVHQRALEDIINSIHAKSMTALYLRRESFGQTRLAGEENWASHFPSLQHLILAHSMRDLPNIGVIARRFPGVKRLTCHGISWRSKTKHIGHVLDSIKWAARHDGHGTDTSVSPSKQGRPAILWPELDTIAMSALDETNINIAWHLYESIFKFHDAGYHIHKLKLPKTFFARPNEGTERLKGIVDLEEYSLDWPTREYGRWS
ncbi:hypothetical protein HWV62_25673 [Athelia sp. TMB]|nr:hypothetical protein HWV62_25673 [Athelia sp. TMB]